MGSETKRILVAEDNAALASVIRFNLQQSGFDVTVAYDGLQAWQFAQSQSFDLVMTDHQMPEMTGRQLCEQLRGREEFARTPIIMLTAKGMELELPRLRDELGITATFMKPFSLKEIVQAAEDCLAAAAVS